MSEQREFDVIVYGATGYTGRLVAEYINGEYGVGGDLKWAMAGRSMDKLKSVRDEIGCPAETPLVTADASDPSSLAELAKRTKVICTTVGPYQLYGTDLVKACAENGTDYVDLCGEPAWMHDMIAAHEETANNSGARIVFSCGFDSIPFDLGVFFLQENAKKQLGEPAQRVRGRVRSMEGKFSGGTAYSLKATLAAAQKDPSIIGKLTNPFSLANGFTGPDQPRDDKPMLDDALGMWCAPFVMATINSKNVHRSNALMNHAYGEDFQYDEMMLAGQGDEGKAVAEYIANTPMIGTPNDPKPGEGPTKEERENGSYDVLFHGTAKSGDVIKVGVKGDKDPGYGSTSKMIAESAICLAKDDLTTPGGVYTPAPAMGHALINRLTSKAGLTFEVEN